MWSNIPAAPAYGVYLSQMIRYSRACGSYQDFLDRGLLLTMKILNQGLLLVKLKSSLRQFYGLHHDMVGGYGICFHKSQRICSTCRKHFSVLSQSWLITELAPRLTWRVPLVEQELLTLPEHLSSHPVFSWVRVTQSLVVCVCFVDCCLSFFNSDCSFGLFKLILLRWSIVESFDFFFNALGW